MSLFYVFCTIIFTVYGQMILKWRLTELNFALAEGGALVKLKSILFLFLDPFIMSSFIAAFLAALSWMAAISKTEISRVYPFMSLAPVVVFILSIPLFNETFSWGKVIGLVLIVCGSFIAFKF